MKGSNKPIEGQLFVESKSGLWRSVKAVFTPPHTLVLDGVSHQVNGARHHAEAPRKQADYGIQIALANGGFLNVAATSGLGECRTLGGTSLLLYFISIFFFPPLKKREI